MQISGDEVDQFSCQRLQAVQIDIALNVGVPIGANGNDDMFQGGHAGVVQLLDQVLVEFSEDCLDHADIMSHSSIVDGAHYACQLQFLRCQEFVALVCAFLFRQGIVDEKW